MAQHIFLRVFFPDEGVENSPDTASPSNADTDPNDCAGENRVKGTDDVCGSCLSGYTEDDTGMCVADETLLMTPKILIGFFMEVLVLLLWSQYSL